MQVTLTPSFVVGVRRLLAHDGLEYPTTMNVLERFNIYPEVSLQCVLCASSMRCVSVSIPIACVFACTCLFVCCVCLCGLVRAFVC